MKRFRLESGNTLVPCPECKKQELQTRFSCIQTTFFCSACKKRFSMDQLVVLLDPAEFDKLADVVSDRLSDRL